MSKKEYESKELYTYLSESKLATRKDFIEKMVATKEYVLIDGMESLIRDRFKFNITKTQMRNIFEIIKEGKDGTITKVNVKLIYMAGKIDKKDVKDFIVLLLDILKKDYDFGQEFIESALAYHKFYARN